MHAKQSSSWDIPKHEETLYKQTSLNTTYKAATMTLMPKYCRTQCHTLKLQLISDEWIWYLCVWRWRVSQTNMSDASWLMADMNPVWRRHHHLQWITVHFTSEVWSLNFFGIKIMQLKKNQGAIPNYPMFVCGVCVYVCVYVCGGVWWGVEVV